MLTEPRLLLWVAIVWTAFAMMPTPGFCRGFGGMHGGMGGMRGGMGGMRGGMGGMNMRGGMGGMGMGGMNMRGGMGGMGMGGMNMRGGMGGMGMGGTNMRGGMGGMGMGGMNMRGGMGGMGMGGMSGGMGARVPSTGGIGGMSGRAGNLGGMGGAMSRFPGADARGFGFAGQRGLSGPGRMSAAPGNIPSRGQLGSFLGLPSDAGMHALAGNRLGLDQRGLRRTPDADMLARGDLARRDFRRGDFYSAGWYRRYPGAWYPRRWAYGDAWAYADWAGMSGWFGYANTQPMYYDYGNNVTYQGDSVYVDGQNVGTADQYYQQASNLASTGAQAQPTDDTEWLPLGVFAMTSDQHTKSNLILQLAVNKDGIIRGNYTATMNDDTQPVQGSVDKKTQRAGWTIGKNTQNVFDTGIYNLTKDEVPVLVHFGKDRTEQWQLVRLNEDQNKDSQSRSQSGSS